MTYISFIDERSDFRQMPKIEKDLLKVKGSDGQWHYVPAVGGNGGSAPTWDAVQNKPFSTLGGGLEVDENGVLSAQGGGGSANAVQYVEQTLTDEQKAQARNNIDADKKRIVVEARRSSGGSTMVYYNVDDQNAAIDKFIAEYKAGTEILLRLYNRDYPLTNIDEDGIVYFSGYIYDAVNKSVGVITYKMEKNKAVVEESSLYGIKAISLDDQLKYKGYAADAKAVGDALTTKLDKNQGADNAGKILGIGEDGIVVPQDKPAGGSVTVDDALSSTSENPVQNKVVTAALAEKITAPTTAAIGQIIKVKSVDASGKPTAWGVADLSSGGSEDWTLLAEQTTTEIVKEISFTLPKSVKHVVSKIWCPKTGATEVNRYINVKIGASYLFYYIAPNIPDKSQTSQLTVSADSIGGGYWRLSYYANRGTKTFDNFDGYNQNESVAVGVTKATYTEANTFAIMMVATDTTQQFPVGTILKVWGY